MRDHETFSSIALQRGAPSMVRDPLNTMGYAAGKCRWQIQKQEAQIRALWRYAGCFDREVDLVKPCAAAAGNGDRRDAMERQHKSAGREIFNNIGEMLGTV